MRRCTQFIAIALLGCAIGRTFAAAPKEMAPASQSTPIVFMEAELRPDTVYVGTESQYVIRVYQRVPITSARLQWTRPTNDIAIAPVGQAHKTSVRRRGIRYQVTQWRFAVTPQQPGELRLSSPQFEATAEGAGHREAVSATAPALHLRSLAPPPDAPIPWLPAQSLELSESWSGALDALPAGEPITRVITLRARGRGGESLPTITMAPIDGVSIYHDQAQTKTMRDHAGVHGLKQQRIVLMTEFPGTIDVPALRIHWWDVTDERAKAVALAAKSLQIAAASSTPTTRWSPPDTPRVSVQKMAWMLTIAIALIAVLLIRWQIRDASTKPMRAAQRVLLNACRRNDPRQARRAMLSWAAHAWPHSPPIQLNDIAMRLNSSELRATLADLDASLYSRHSHPWTGHALGRCVCALPKQRIQPTDQTIDLLHSVVMAHRDT